MKRKYSISESETFQKFIILKITVECPQSLFFCLCKSFLPEFFFYLNLFLPEFPLKWTWYFMLDKIGLILNLLIYGIIKYLYNVYCSLSTWPVIRNKRCLRHRSCLADLTHFPNSTLVCWISFQLCEKHIFQSLKVHYDVFGRMDSSVWSSFMCR